MELLFQKISYHIPSSKKKKSLNAVADAEKAIKESNFVGKRRDILSGVCGKVGAAKLLAMLGPSGCGKTTLMDILAGRKKSGILTGEVAVINEESGELIRVIKQDDVYYKRICAYVMQDDVFLANLTVLETLNYAFDLKVQEKVSKKEKQERIETILKNLNLEKVANSMVGSSLKRGLSGGERRRLSIAVELVTNPKILFLDEPTSGLDSMNAYKVIKAVKNLCELYKTTVVCTIHQPSSTIFHLFDDILLLQEGKLAYFGPGADSIGYMSRIGFTCPQYMNPAEFMLDVVLNPDKESVEGRKNVTDLFVQSPDFAMLVEAVEKGTKNRGEKETGQIDEIKATIKGKTGILLSRTLRNTLRDPNVIFVRTFSAWAIAFLVGGIFFQQANEPKSIPNRINALLFLMCVFSLFCIPAISKIIEERLLFQRERASGAYSTSPYFIAVWLVEVPILVAMVVGYGAICYWMVGLENEVWTFVFFLATIIMVVNTGFSLSQAIAAYVESTNMAIATYMIILVYSLLLGGFIVKLEDLPSAIQWLMYSSYFHFGFEALVLNEFERKSWGLQALETLSMQNKNKFVDLAALTAFFFGFRLLAFIGLKYAQKEKR